MAPARSAAPSARDCSSTATTSSSSLVARTSTRLRRDGLTFRTPNETATLADPRRRRAVRDRLHQQRRRAPHDEVAGHRAPRSTSCATRPAMFPSSARRTASRTSAWPRAASRTSTPCSSCCPRRTSSPASCYAVERPRRRPRRGPLSVRRRSADRARYRRHRRERIRRAPTSTNSMRLKYGKLLQNLGNAVQALCPRDDAAASCSARPRRSARLLRLRRHRVRRARRGCSTAGSSRSPPSPARRAPAARRGRASPAAPASIETDYLNGEISLLGRLHGVPTPANRALQPRRPPSHRRRRPRLDAASRNRTRDRRRTLDSGWPLKGVPSVMAVRSGA